MKNNNYKNNNCRNRDLLLDKLLTENEKYIWSIYEKKGEIIALNDKLEKTMIAKNKEKILTRISELEKSIVNDITKKEIIMKKYKELVPDDFTE